MGEKFVNYQIRSSSMENVINIVKNLTRTKAYVSPPKNGWITVYDQMSDYEFKYTEISNFSQNLSASLLTVAFAFIVFSGLHFIYLVYDTGKLVDEFYDDPEASEFGFDYVNDAVIERFKGDPDKLLKYCLPSTTLQSISHILISNKNRDIEFLGQEAAYELALLLGIDEYRAINGYSYFEDHNLYNEIDPNIENAKDFLLVKNSFNN
ncbi:hypothetical protein [Nostoc sp. CALU 546]|uniref:hypothetical protein n=1 Tax=Nostoc sp. CALU 546 TaxID=1867241 RepID=UPI003B67B697